MQLQHLHLLDLVVRTGNFRAAAQAAGVTQPAVSQAMQGLERSLGVKLFERSGRLKVPTATALQVVHLGRQLQSGLGQLQGPAKGGRSSARAPRSSLQVGIAPAAGFLYGSLIEQAWHAHRPDGVVRFQLGPAEQLLSAVEAGELDLVIVPRPRKYEPLGMVEVAVHTSTPQICLRAGHPLARARSLSDIAHAAWAVAGLGGTAGHVLKEAYRVRALGRPRIVAQCDDYAMLLRIVAQSDLLCVLPHQALLDSIPAGMVRPLKIREGLPRYEVCLYLKAAPPGGRHAEALRAVVQAVTGQACAKIPPCL